jgi:hypothetical protein
MKGRFYDVLVVVSVVGMYLSLMLLTYLGSK